MGVINKIASPENSFIFFTLIGFFAACYYRTIKGCLLTRLKHLSLCNGVMTIDLDVVPSDMIEDILHEEIDKN